MRHWLSIAEGFGKITAFFSLLMAAPAVVSVIFNDGLETIYISRAAGVFAVGALLAVVGRRWREELNLRGGFFTGYHDMAYFAGLCRLAAHGGLAKLKFCSRLF